ncbi:glycosyltransferase family 2 protein [Cellulomonas sp. PhB143]|uniref:glycosyltransferase family 2 protein n=1 Tax=Cellulomonas sp. PhB143 TaxID=2485186 RepID=UPI000F4825B3|nr:glycosyltransferase [Cellulomonas sp. PhB143]ROS79013.1 GT2 family glycosyltransferase [Cellulomonas sp. PhB143]
MGAEPVRAAVPPATEDDRVSVVVMSRDRRDDLAGTLPRHRAPLVYVDNGSGDGSVELARELRPDADVVALGRNVGALARTAGVRRARTPYVAFADDDSWWEPGSLARAADLLEAHPDVAVVHARVLVGPDETEDPLMPVLRGSPLSRRGLPGPRLLGFMACGVVVRRADLLACGGFDPLVRFPGEEEPVALRLAAGGRAIVHADDLVVHHHPSPRRHPDGVRARAVARSALVTAVLLLPWRTVLARARALLAAGGPRALPPAGVLLSAVARRRRCPRWVERDLARLAG